MEKYFLVCASFGNKNSSWMHRQECESSAEGARLTETICREYLDEHPDRYPGDWRISVEEIPAGKFFGTKNGCAKEHKIFREI